MNILVINSSLHGKKSATRAMVAAYLEAARDRDTTIVEHDLATGPVPHLSPEAGAAIRGEEGSDLDDAHRSDELIAELERADVLVLGVPMYNFTIPSMLKSWIDNVVRARRTFSYEGGGPKGLLDPAKKVLLFTSSDGVYSSGPTEQMNFVEPYLRSILGFIGLTDFTVVSAEGQAMPDGEANRAAAIDEARSLAG